MPLQLLSIAATRALAAGAALQNVCLALLAFDGGYVRWSDPNPPGTVIEWHVYAEDFVGPGAQWEFLGAVGPQTNCFFVPIDRPRRFFTVAALTAQGEVPLIVSGGGAGTNNDPRIPAFNAKPGTSGSQQRAQSSQRQITKLFSPKLK